MFELFFSAAMCLLWGTGTASAVRDVRTEFGAHDLRAAVWPSAALIVLSFFAAQNALTVVRNL